MLRLLCCLLPVLAVPAAAQQISGSISGNVLDPSGAPVAGATVAAINTGTSFKLQTTTNELGFFEFLSKVSGMYDIEVEAKGFKKLRQTGLTLSANQRLSTGPLALELGNVTESVQITGRVDAVQTVSAERSANITRSQIDRIQTMARDPLELVLLLPGVLSPGGTTAAVQLPQSFREFSVQGSRGNNKNFLVDGINALNTVTNQAASITPNIDSVEEVQVQLSNYQAEFGRSAGPAINYITRSGTRDFHGSAYFYIRNEALNATDFFDNKFSRPKPRYRYRTEGFTIGGPAYWPGKFNTDRNKLFFFYAYSEQPVFLPPPLHQLQMPTELERRGDFSQTVNQAGARINIIDPTTAQPFAGNIVPTNRINAFGQQILNFFPVPNTTDSLRRFNFQKTGIQYRQPRTEHTLKMDYNPSTKYTFSGRYIQDSNDIITDYASNFSITNTRLYRPGKNLSMRAVQIFSPHMTNEVLYGYNRLRNNTTPETAADVAKLQRDPNGVRIAQLNP
ncbi:MAG: carboxypeptidase regulatory-like domain-containing protein, partial [Bryobacteraceae bacterium]